ncbi:hypothetical protein [Shewanella psychrophila]|uniref:hypothetical protein n=1 Tax=Shewanella psychrophila TaxID=225848 RepID=UPI0011EA5C1C|nr:hypothetical protein [Shewanella psychrophila]
MKAFQIEEVLVNEDRDELKGLKASTCAADLDIQFDAAVELPELSDQLRPFILSANEHVNPVTNKRRISWLLVIILVIIFHLVMMFILDLLWTPAPLLYPESKINGTESEVPQLSAYMYFQAPVIAQEKSKRVKSEAPSPQLAADDLTQGGLQQVQPKENSKQMMSAVRDDKPVIEERLAQKSVVQDRVVKEIKHPLVKQDFSTSKKALSVSKPAYFSSSAYSKNDESERLNMSTFSASTQEYLSRQREVSLNELSVEQANQYTQTKTLSEMDGEMFILELPELDIWSDAESLDNELDPNRIVKKGNTCYRIVKTPNPINPHAENLGYPFRCDGDSVAAALMRAIAKKVHRKIH